MATTKTVPVAKAKATKVSTKGAVATTPKGKIITMMLKDSKKLSDFIDATLREYHDNGRRLHVAFVSALWHVATHGNPALLNRLFHGLRTNDQNAARLYIRRAHILIGLKGENPEGKDAEIINAAAEAGKVVDLRNREFFVVNGHTSDQAKALVKLCEDRFLDPDGKQDKMFLERNNFAEVRNLGDTQALEALVNSAKRILEPSERTHVHLSKKVEKFIQTFRDQAEAMMNQTTLNAG